MEDLKSSTESLKEAVEKINKLNSHNYDKELAGIEKSLNAIKDGYMAGSKDEKYEITETIANVYTAKSELSSLKIVLNTLAKSTISRVDRLMKSLKAFEKETNDSRITRKFRDIVRKMKTILLRSDRNLKEALVMYKDFTKNLITIKSDIDKFVIQLDDYMKNKDGKLQKWIHTYRTEAYVGAAACVVSFLLCPIVYAATALGVEVDIGNAKENLKKQIVRFEAVKNSTTKLIGLVNNGLEFIEKEEELIRYWAEKVLDVQDMLPFAELPVKDIQDDVSELENLRDTLGELREACQNYLSHS